MTTRETDNNTSERPDDVVRKWARSPVALSVRILKPETSDEGRPLVLLEGDRCSLRFIAELILAQSEDELDCGFQLRAGTRFFHPDSEAGLYIHALPCATHKLEDETHQVPGKQGDDHDELN